jgi:hypothetical protein
MDPPHSTSSTRLAAVNGELYSVMVKMIERLKERRKRGHLDVSDDQIEVIARLARVVAHDSVTGGYNQGRRDGRALARLELGHPVDDLDGAVSPTVLCQMCGRKVD